LKRQPARPAAGKELKVDLAKIELVKPIRFELTY
jgi:hypothetical protein